MVPGADRERDSGPDYVCEDVEGIEVAAVGQQGLDDFGADGEAGGAG